MALLSATLPLRGQQQGGPKPGLRGSAHKDFLACKARASVPTAALTYLADWCIWTGIAFKELALLGSRPCKQPCTRGDQCHPAVRC